MLHKPGFDFSFSGLKTAVMLEVRKAEVAGKLRREDVAASFQRAAVDTLVARAIKAANAHQLERIVVAGGVGANKLLRKEIAEHFDGSVFYPRMEFCTDNGAMIAIAGALRLAEATPADEIKVRSRWSIASLDVPRPAQ
jgi:N6-L-threonylcarbamoyladenine synthase